MRIGKSFTFSAAHHLDGLDEGHPCARTHGHNYTVVLELHGTTDHRGMVIDYGDLKPFGDFIDTVLDHKYLNDVIDVQPTAENLAQFLFDVAAEEWGNLVAAVSVSETPKTFARVDVTD